MRNTKIVIKFLRPGLLNITTIYLDASGEVKNKNKATLIINCLFQNHPNIIKKSSNIFQKKCQTNHPKNRQKRAKKITQK